MTDPIAATLTEIRENAADAASALRLAREAIEVREALIAAQGERIRLLTDRNQLLEAQLDELNTAYHELRGSRED